MPGKIIDMLRKREEDGVTTPFYSFEYFPPRTEAGAVNLIARLDRMSSSNVAFVDITWGAGGGDPGDITSVTSSMSIASTALNLCGIDTMLHMTCANATRSQITAYLEAAKKNGIRNILALRGDPPPGEEWSTPEDGMAFGAEMVAHIRKEFGDYFGICVAGYPNGHPDCVSYEDDLKHLKEKVDAGADFIITQLFFETSTFKKYVEDCRALGIMCPIVPGILPIQGYASLRHLVKLSQLKPPQWIVDAIEPMRDDDEKIRAFGVQLAVKQCRELMELGVPGFHLYTLNREVAVKEILTELDLWTPTATPRTLPFVQPASDKRNEDEVRPIHWALRPKSYLARTREWDDFPNGRWGDSSSPAFGDLNDFYLFHVDKAIPAELKKNWVKPLKSHQDVYDTFTKYILGDIKSMPWSTEPLASETSLIQYKLARLNMSGILTINSQPAINGKPSNDPIHGWGAPNGFVYQKAYIEFFTNKSTLDALLSVIDHHPSITYSVWNADGSTHLTNGLGRPIAVTWGVFPGKEIVQPTVVDPESFKVWKDEAFSLWNKMWGDHYDAESDKESRAIIADIHDSYYLINIVHNDYISHGTIFDIFEELLARRDLAQRDLARAITATE